MQGPMSMLVFWSLQECELLYGDPHGASRLTILTQIVSLCCLVLSDLSSVTFNQLLAACCRRPPAGRARCTKGVRVTDGDHDARGGVAAVPPRLRELSEGEGPHGLYGGQILHLGREPWTAKADRGWIVQPERLVASCWQREWGEFMVSIEQYLSAGLQPQIMNQTTTCRQQHRMSSRQSPMQCWLGTEDILPTITPSACSHPPFLLSVACGSSHATEDRNKACSRAKELGQRGSCLRLALRHLSYSQPIASRTLPPSHQCHQECENQSCRRSRHHIPAHERCMSPPKLPHLGLVREV